MSGDELHEAINAVIIDQTWVTYERVGQDAVVAGSGLAADAILALPEMQAIKVVLWHHYAQWDGSNPCPEDMMPDLPESVIDWVLDEDVNHE